MPWVSRGELRRLLKQLARAEDRVLAAEVRLEEERAEKDRVNTHLLSMFLRSRELGGYPVPPKDTDALTPAAEVVHPAIDPGELAVLVEEGKRYGISAAEVETLVRKERGLPVDD